MFRSVSNIDAASCKTLEGRQRHDFVDDLESFFWVYAWMMTVHNGPGAKRLVPPSDRAVKVKMWETSLDPSFHLDMKDYYLEAFGGGQIRKFTPYFSKPVYVTLLHSFRKLLYVYWHQKMERPADAHGNRLELDFFPEMEDIYEKVLGYFDEAISTLSPAPKPPPRTQPERQAKLFKRRRDEDYNPPSLPQAKKARVGHLARPLKRQLDEDLTPSSLPRSKRARVDLPCTVHPKTAVQETAHLVPLNVRRSSRLKAGR